MSRVLVLTTDLPIFPGKNGHDFFNLRHLATERDVTVVAPRYPANLPAGVENLRRSVQSVLSWPDPVSRVPLFIDREASIRLPSWSDRLPRRLRWWLLKKLLKIDKAPADAFQKLEILANCAPYLLQAIADRSWQATIIIQSNLEPWLQYIPGPGATIAYFHDVRSDYLGRRTHAQRGAIDATEKRLIHRQETNLCRSATIVGFVSELDKQRAQRAFGSEFATAVATIPVDLDYFTPAPSDWSPPESPTILFTGHLSHPPNVDAVLYFLSHVWPLILKSHQTVRFVIAGLLPASNLRAALSAAPRTELYENVPDIRPYFWNARVYVVPMQYGGGVRQKIFEAWAMEIPVVCTQMAAEGIAVRNGENCWIENTPESFASRTVGLLLDANPSPLIRAAKAAVAATQSIEIAARQFAEMVTRGIALKKSRPYRLLYDLRWMEIGKAGGSEQMTHELLSAVSHLDYTNSYRIYCPRSTYTEWDFPKEFRVKGFFSDPNETAVGAINDALANQLALRLNASPVRTQAMRTLAELRRMDFDFVHSMVGYIHPDLRAFPHILTALDLQHLHFPEFFTSEEREERDRLYRESAEHAEHILCLSEFTRQDMHHKYKVPLDRMSTVWIIPSRPANGPLRTPLREKLLAQMGVFGPYLFFPGHCWPHKNHARLVDAFALIVSSIPQDISLIFTGRPFPDDHPARLRITAHKLGSRIRHLGYRTPIEIQALYEQCFALVFPSLFEGFGLPVAEAILAGKPVVCSNTTSLPEIAGAAALTFDPLNTHDIGGRLLEIINDQSQHRSLANAAINRRPLFSPRSSALKTLEIYQEVFNRLYS